MSEPRFQIVFRGKLLAGFDLPQVCSNLAKLFRVDEARIGAMLAQPKWVVKAGLDKAQAQRFQDALREAGMMVAVMNDAPTTGAPSAPAVSVASQPIPAPAATAATPAAVIAAPPAAAQATTQATGVEITATTADTPLAVRPAVKAYEPDLSAFSLAPVGAVIDQQSVKPQARDYDLSGLTVAAPGTQIVEKKVVKALEIDTSAMQVEAVDTLAEKPRSALQKEMG